MYASSKYLSNIFWGRIEVGKPSDDREDKKGGRQSHGNQAYHQSQVDAMKIKQRQPKKILSLRYL